VSELFNIWTVCLQRIEGDEDVTVCKDSGATEMKKILSNAHLAGLMLALLNIGACSAQEPVEIAVDEPDPELYFVRGYRSETDPCKLTGETEFTNQFLDDAADLVTCPTGHEGATEFIEATGAIVVTQTQSYTLYSVPRR
jgi:hypothetical protein